LVLVHDVNGLPLPFAVAAFDGAQFVGKAVAVLILSRGCLLLADRARSSVAVRFGLLYLLIPRYVRDGFDAVNQGVVFRAVSLSPESRAVVCLAKVDRRRAALGCNCDGCHKGDSFHASLR